MQLAPLLYSLVLMTVSGSIALAAETNETEVAEKINLIQTQFDYSSQDLHDKLVLITSKQGLGNGFIAHMDGKVYLFTNQHTLLGADQLRFTTVSGIKLRPRKIELSVSRDIARLQLADETKGFSLATARPMDLPIGIFGHTQADDVEQDLFGTVIGVGAEIVEVSPEFDVKSSGSPVLNLQQEVIAMASHVRKSGNYAGKAGTRFENTTRYFCYRLDGSAWASVEWKKYNEKYGKIYRQNSQFIEGLIEVLTHWGDTPKDRLRIAEYPEKSLVSWVENHNAMLGKFKNESQKKRFATSYSQSVLNLAEKCKSRARMTRLFLGKRDLSGFLREELERQANDLESLATLFNTISHQAQDYR